VADPPIPLDNPNAETYPPSPTRRRIRTALGCFALLVLLVLFVWFVANHTATVSDRTPFGP
jgi:hypothetical protein